MSETTSPALRQLFEPLLFPSKVIENLELDFFRIVLVPKLHHVMRQNYFMQTDRAEYLLNGKLGLPMSVKSG